MNVINLINSMEVRSTSMAVRESPNGKLDWIIENGTVNPNKHNIYGDCTVKSWHCEPNLEDNGGVNWASPCRVIVDISALAKQPIANL